jgi:hypothetical protein
MYKKLIAILPFLFASLRLCLAQDTTSVKTDSVSKFDATNKKMEKLFKIIPVPLYSYSTEADIHLAWLNLT